MPLKKRRTGLKRKMTTSNLRKRPIFYDPVRKVLYFVWKGKKTRV
jgi:hypothetical protein